MSGPILKSKSAWLRSFRLSYQLVSLKGLNRNHSQCSHSHSPHQQGLWGRGGRTRAGGCCCSATFPLSGSPFPIQSSSQQGRNMAPFSINVILYNSWDISLLIWKEKTSLGNLRPGIVCQTTFNGWWSRLRNPFNPMHWGAVSPPDAWFRSGAGCAGWNIVGPEQGFLWPLVLMLLLAIH